MFLKQKKMYVLNVGRKHVTFILKMQNRKIVMLHSRLNHRVILFKFKLTLRTIQEVLKLNRSWLSDNQCRAVQFFGCSALLKQNESIKSKIENIKKTIKLLFIKNNAKLKLGTTI